MENTDSYLHKKFKKQLSVHPKLQNDKENKDAAQTEPSEEKAQNYSTPKKPRNDEENAFVYRQPSEHDRAVGHHTNIDNNNRVPNQSTNSPSFTANTNYSKSSISVETQVANQQSSNSYISYVVSNQPDHQPASFDTKFSEQTNYTVSLSSILDNVYSRQSYSNAEEVYPHYNLGEDYRPRLNSADEASESKPDDVPRPPDKNTSGKYVCHYCSLVCSKPSVLQKHIRAHTNERPYPCKSCGFSFKTRSNLYKHCRSRTHANRVMGNKTQETGTESDEKCLNDSPNHSESKEEQAALHKPYKPRFHTGKPFFDNISKETFEDEGQNSQNPTSELLSLHISDIINKNNSIVNSNESHAKKRSGEDPAPGEFRYAKAEPAYSNVSEQKPVEEPLNLTNKNRKRSMSEVAEPITQKSLIKELLLKNLSSDMQCPYCKMIFQTVTELDVHKYRSCKGKPSNAKYTRSSSVNVASILTQNKNAFDNIPQLQNTVFPLNSPGPFLGNTRLIDVDKSKSFSFDAGNLPLLSPSEPSPSYLLSPFPFDREKKPGVKLFGGEVQVHSSGETKSFKIDSKEDKFESESKYADYEGKISENRVVQSSLQSGGTVLTNKTAYSKHQDMKTPQDVIRVFSTTSSPSIDISNCFKRTRFTFDSFETVSDNGQEGFRDQPDTPKSYGDEPSPLYKNIMDFSQTALRKLTPNLRQPSFSMAGIPVPNSPLYNNISGETFDLLRLVSPKPKIIELPRSPMRATDQEKFLDNRKAYYESKPTTPTNLYNPLNLLVNGKVVRHVPGMPGPVVAPDPPVDMAYRSNIVAVVRPMQQSTAPLSPLVLDRFSKASNSVQQKEKALEKLFLLPEKVAERPSKSPNNYSPVERIRTSSALLQVKKGFEFEPAKESSKADYSEVKSTHPSNLKLLAAASSEPKQSENRASEGELKKFVRPNSLALKPTIASLKQHHGLTPTMFNQILISPDTPRVAKKYAEHFLHGNYFSYLGLKSSTKPVYCTLNKTQPFYVPYFKKLSMYSEWRQQDTKQDKLYVINYDSRQKSGRYTVAGTITANVVTHSSYKFMVSETSSSNPDRGDEPQKNNAVLGGYECNEDYTYIRGRGRGRYVCDQCGIRCKKPSMLKKHIRTHSNDRPYTCSHCNFSFKTKGNLTKHMKSKAHSKNSTASSGSSSSTQHSVHSSDSDTEDSGMDSSDESTRQQEHEAAYGLLSLSQKPAQSGSGHCDSDLAHLRSSSPNDLLMTPEEIAHVSKTNYAKNKILDERNSGFRSRRLNEMPLLSLSDETTETRNVRNFLGTGCVNRPLTYPYTSALPPEKDMLPSPKPSEGESLASDTSVSPEPKSIKQFHVIQRYLPNCQLSPKLPEAPAKAAAPPPPPVPRKVEGNFSTSETVTLNNKKNAASNPNRALPTLKVNDVVITTESVGEPRKRKFSSDVVFKNKIQRNDEVMDLSMTTTHEKIVNGVEERVFNNVKPAELQKNVANEIYNTLQKVTSTSPKRFDVNEDKEETFNHKAAEATNNNGTVIILRPLQTEEHMNVSYTSEQHSNSDDQGKCSDYDNSAMETLADIATKQVKLEKNTLAKSVASEFLKLATKNDSVDGCRESANYGPVNKDVNDIIVKSEGDKSCTICAKSFNKPSQLRLHMNIHYLERPFRCDSCSVSFRTKGHLQKHERSASHHNKLSSSPALSSSEPRPFKCSDCNIAFRIHGHLAKHLRSKMHIMKLECLAKIPFGLYAELERSNSLLTEINTSDGDQCLESLKILARKVFINDPSKINQLELRENVIAD